MNIVCPSPSQSAALYEEVVSVLSGIDYTARVIVNLPNSLLLVNVIKHIFESAMVSIPIDKSMSERQRQFIMQHAQADFIVSETGVERFKTDRNLSSHVDDRFILYTSGSTGNPKGVLLREKAIAHNARAVGRLHGFDMGYAHATCLPFTHCNAIMMSLIGCYIYQNKLVIEPNLQLERYIQLIEDNDVRTASIVPAILKKLIDSVVVLPECLDYFITAAAPLTQQMAKKFHDKYGNKLCQGYGLTEAVNFSSMMPKLSENEFIKQYIDQHPPVGLPLQDTEFKFDNDGHLLVRGDNLMTGYWKNEKATKAAFNKEGFLFTGDRGYVRDGYIVLNGRFKEVINRGGVTLYPVDIENELLKNGLATDFCIARVSNSFLHDDIGLFLSKNIAYTDIEKVIRCSNIKPGVVQCGWYEKTASQKPKRLKLGEKLFSTTETDTLYIELMRASHVVSKKLAGFRPTGDKKINKIISEARTFYKSVMNCSETKKIIGANDRLDEGSLSSPASRALKQLNDNFELIYTGSLPSDKLISSTPGLWEDLMCKWPMGAYASQAAKFLIDNRWLQGNIIELGAGVGNASRLLKNHVDGHYIRTDVCTKILNRQNIESDIAYYDFNLEGSWSDLDCIFAVNALHCSDNIEKSLLHIYSMLNMGGKLLLAEGSPATVPGLPWALNFYFCLFDGWWDKTGFISRHHWLSVIRKIGFRKWGYSVYRAGRYDLGGLIWAEK